MKTLNVEQVHNRDWHGSAARSATDPERHVYKVAKVTNSITPRVGDLLSHIEINELCDSVDWKVIIV